MYDPITLLLAIAVVLLISIVVIFLVLLIVILVMIKKTIQQLQSAISNVEDTAIRSLSPFITFKSMFSDTRSFVAAAAKVIKTLQGKKTKSN